MRCRPALPLLCPVRDTIAHVASTRRWVGATAGLLHHALGTAGVKRGSRTLVLTEPARNPMDNRLRTAEIMFESLEVPAAFVWSQPALSMYATGRITGCIVDAGLDCTHVAAMLEGHLLRGATQQLDVGGEDITTRLGTLLAERGVMSDNCSMPGVARRRVDAIKAKYCYVPTNINEELRRWKQEGVGMFKENERVYRLPDGATIAAEDERFWAPEALFRPALLSMTRAALGASELGRESDSGTGLLASTSACIAKCGDDLVRPLSRNIVMAGGTSLIPGALAAPHDGGCRGCTPSCGTPALTVCHGP